MRDEPDVYRAIADATRRTILDELAACDGWTLFEICGRLAMTHGLTSTRQAISQYLAVLEQVGLVRTQRRDCYEIHHINPGPLRSIVQRGPTDREGPTS